MQRNPNPKQIINRFATRVRILSLVMLCLVLPFGAHAQFTSEQKLTNGLFNGRLWSELDKNTKTIFLMGCSDGFVLGGRTVHAVAENSAGMKFPELSKILKGMADDLKFPDLAIAEIIKEMDLFYSEGANGPIPIVSALEYIRHKAAGDTAENLQYLLFLFRKTATFR